METPHPQVEIEATCEMHHGSGRLVIRRERERIVPDAYADHCCVITLENPAVTRLFDAIGDDQRLHLLAHAEAAATALSGHGRALCGWRIPAAGIPLNGPTAGFCTAEPVSIRPHLVRVIPR